MLNAASVQATASCVDSDAQQCPLWKANGDCTTNSAWMQSNCCKSCSAADSAPTAAAPAAATPAAPAAPCVDSDAQQCPLWKANGDCTTNSAWMQSNCRLSCGVCLPPLPKQFVPCADSDKTQCPLWAQNGDCDKNAEWMKGNCQRSCKVCTLGAKVIYDAQHPEVADWDGYLPGETSHGCQKHMPMTGDPTDNCMELCANTPPCKCAAPAADTLLLSNIRFPPEAVAVQFVRMPPQLTCVGTFDWTELGRRAQVLLG